MPTISKTYNNDKEELFELGCARVKVFCKRNNINVPSIHLVEDIDVNSCAYYRNDNIVICNNECASLAPIENCHNWNWPGSTTDRTPYGVLCYELGHHCDLVTGRRLGLKLGNYSSEYSWKTREYACEGPISSYCPNNAEWFAEMFRLFVTNAYFLQLIRPQTFRLLSKEFHPVSSKNWVAELGDNVPTRVVKALNNKIR